MSFIRSFLINFIAIFLINQLAPGIEVGEYERVPNVGADLVFSLVLGFFNACVFPLLFILEMGPNPRKIAILTFLFSFSGYIFLAFVPMGIQVVSLGGVLFGGIFSWLAGFITNYLEWRRDVQKP